MLKLARPLWRIAALLAVAIALGPSQSAALPLFEARAGAESTADAPPPSDSPVAASASEGPTSAAASAAEGLVEASVASSASGGSPSTVRADAYASARYLIAFGPPSGEPGHLLVMVTGSLSGNASGGASASTFAGVTFLGSSITGPLAAGPVSSVLDVYFPRDIGPITLELVLSARLTAFEAGSASLTASVVPEPAAAVLAACAAVCAALVLGSTAAASRRRVPGCGP